MKVYVSSHRHLKKHGLFSGALKIQRVWRQGDRTLLGGHCGDMGTDMTEKRTCTTSAVWKNVKPKETGGWGGGGGENEWLGNNRKNATQSEKWLTPDKKNLANFKRTKFTIIHIRWFSSSFFFCLFSPLVLALYRNKSLFKKTKCCTKGISCPVNITHRI